MTPLLQTEALRFAYRQHSILYGISLDFWQGEIVSLLGPNGSGKTTLLKLLLGLLAPASGSVCFQGRPLTSIARAELAKHLAYVPQVHHEAFAYTVEDVVLMGRMPHHSFFSTYSQEDRRLALAALERLHILPLRQHPYTEISGGERQLTLIARALAQGATTFIMDEPVNGLDYGNQMRLLADITGLAKDGYTFIMTTHFPDHALMTADRVVLLKDGSVLADGPPDLVITKETLRTLYRIEVEVLTIHNQINNRICVPAWALRERHGLAA